DLWQSMLLDREVFCVPQGVLSEYHLEWLDRAIAAVPHSNKLILLHHNPLPSGCSCLDQHILSNPHMLDDVFQL
ncbi:3',5'-cyclic-AMP phosphodiesterase, partial [Erwinia amylovora]|nr:3',5'-cyclic-AMP phosphodiesterase [Erwinia amylovora]